MRIIVNFIHHIMKDSLYNTKNQGTKQGEQMESYTLIDTSQLSIPMVWISTQLVTKHFKYLTKYTCTNKL